LIGFNLAATISVEDSPVSFGFRHHADQEIKDCLDTLMDIKFLVLINRTAVKSGFCNVLTLNTAQFSGRNFVAY